MKNLIYKIKKKLSISKKGFTLIEMLVVVLIIGILAGIALPQYTKTVEKTRLAEALLTANALQKAIDMYILQNGYYSPSGIRTYFHFDELDIELQNNYDNCSDYGCTNKYFSVGFPSCSSIECDFGITRHPSSDDKDFRYLLTFYRLKGEEGWGKICTSDQENKFICTQLESQGFQREEC